MLLGAFIACHLINHAALFVSVEQHIQLMESLRTVYRHRWIECVLLLCVLLQVISGVYFIWERRKRNRTHWLSKLQVVSGAYLAFFLLNHVGAVLFARTVSGLDTNAFDCAYAVPK
ncbi:MAG: hypothetical protein AAGF06_08345 [Pseudomonadota bacterium]